jgi:hypothetical protein
MYSDATCLAMIEYTTSVYESSAKSDISAMCYVCCVERSMLNVQRDTAVEQSDLIVYLLKLRPRLITKYIKALTHLDTTREAWRQEFHVILHTHKLTIRRGVLEVDGERFTAGFDL